MRLDSILESLDTTTEKVAADNNTASSDVSTVDTTKQELLASLTTDGLTKTASEEVTSPVMDLEKIAADVAKAEEESIVKEAQLYGASVCDGFMQRMSMYEKSAEDMGVEAPNNTTGVNSTPIEDFHKVASDYYHDEEGSIYTAAEINEVINAENNVENNVDDQEKFAHESFPGVEFTERDLELTNNLIKEASDQGIHISDEEAIEKLASDAFSEGYSDMMTKCAALAEQEGVTHVFEKAAAEAHTAGYMDTMEEYAEKLAEAGETEVVELMEKSAFDAGYSDAMEKIAGSAFDQGISDMDELLRQNA